MANRRNDEWEDNYEIYSPGQVEAVLEYCGVEVVSDTATHFLVLCPFHGNTDSAAMAVDKYKGLWTCFNPACMNSGTLEEMLRRTKALNPFQAARVILKNRNAEKTSFEERLAEAMNKEPDFVEFPQESLDRLYNSFKGSKGEEYMRSRGFDDSTLDHFRIGYSAKKDMVVVPMHDPNGMPVGFIGRAASHNDKRFRNTDNLPKRKTAWNFHRAKRAGETVVICESSFDAMRVHQAGYPNVIALLGGHVSPLHLKQIMRTFSTIVIMTDYDEKQYKPNCRMCNYKPCKGHRAGRELGRSLVKGLPNKKIKWAAFDDKCVYPNWPLAGVRSKPAKDASDMTDDEIRQCLRNAISNLEYTQWGIEEKMT